MIESKWVDHVTDDVIARFWGYVQVGSDAECWPWMGRLNESGYGRLFINLSHRNGVLVRAHRLSFFLSHGHIAPHLVIDHLCRRPECVNPAHLELVTQPQNVLRGQGWAPRRKAQTHCKRGHEFTPENTYRSPSRGTRTCRECRRLADLAKRSAA